MLTQFLNSLTPQK